MIVPTRDKIRPLTKYTEDRFGRWLLNGLESYEARGRFAFAPVQTYVGLQADIVEDLVEIFHVLEGQEQSAFQAGVAIALAHVDYRAGKILTIERLLNLASQVGAWEALDVISEKHRLNWLRRDAGDEPLFGVTLRTAASLARNAGHTKHTKRAADLLVKLSRARRFPSAYAEAVLLTLCRLRPKKAWEYLTLLRPHLDAEFGFVGDHSLKSDQAADAAERARMPIRRRLVTNMSSVLDHDGLVRVMRHAHEDGANPDHDWWIATAYSLLVSDKLAVQGGQSASTESAAELGIPAHLDQLVSPREIADEREPPRLSAGLSNVVELFPNSRVGRANV